MTLMYIVSTFSACLLPWLREPMRTSSTKLIVAVSLVVVVRFVLPALKTGTLRRLAKERQVRFSTRSFVFVFAWSFSLVKPSLFLSPQQCYLLHPHALTLSILQATFQSLLLPNEFSRLLTPK